MPRSLDIECKLTREGGTHLTMADGTEYHFKPRPQDGRHVATVEGDEHIGRLLQISEGYAIAPAVDEAEAQASAPESQKSQGSPKDSGSEARKTDDAKPSGKLEDMSDDDLRATYEAELGRKPHGKAGRSTMISAIEAGREEKAGKASG